MLQNSAPKPFQVSPDIVCMSSSVIFSTGFFWKNLWNRKQSPPDRINIFYLQSYGVQNKLKVIQQLAMFSFLKILKSFRKVFSLSPRAKNYKNNVFILGLYRLL